MKRILPFLLFFLLAGLGSGAQVLLRGAIYDYNRQPLAAVSVLSSSGKGTITDSNGRYLITLKPEDSVWFSYLGKPTIKYPVRNINTFNSFDLALHVNITQLKEVKITEKNYKRDSLQNRQDYAKVFNFQRPNPLNNVVVSNGGVGFDFDALIGMFQFGKNKRMEAFQKRLIQQEQDHFIDYRFNKRLIKQLTGLDGSSLDTFVLQYRPSYEFCAVANDYELREYIMLRARIFRMQQENR